MSKQRTFNSRCSSSDVCRRVNSALMHGCQPDA
jgi:hypothetical protein